MANEKDVKNNKKETKNKKSFFKDFKAELKKVIWPTPKQLVNNTVAVVTIVVITAAIVFVLDVMFDLLSKYGINNLKSHVRGYNTVQLQDDHEHDHDHDHHEHGDSCGCGHDHGHDHDHHHADDVFTNWGITTPKTFNRST